jgi:hypothetical protein
MTFHRCSIPSGVARPARGVSGDTMSLSTVVARPRLTAPELARERCTGERDHDAGRAGEEEGEHDAAS